MTDNNLPQETSTFGSRAEATISEIQHLVDQNPELAANVVDFSLGEKVIQEGAPNHALFVLINGTLSLSKRLPGNENLEVSRHSRGELVGVHSFAIDNRDRKSVV